jgi:acetolactate synthase-1/2/3 large subunit
MQKVSSQNPGAVTAKAPLTGGRLLVDCLRAQGVDRIFGVPGESYLEVLDALVDVPGIEFVCTRHEGAAANMAEADGKLTNKPGVCLVTRGPGATHAAIGVHTAAQDSTPMLLLVGQVPRDHRGREAWQEIDYGQMFGTVAKWVAEIQDPARIPEYISRAFAVATSGRPGPVVLSLPEDMLSQELPSPVDITTLPLMTGTQGAPAPAKVEALLAELRAAQRPLIWVGGSGWTPQDCVAFQEFVARWDLPVIASFRRQDVLDNRHDNYVGHTGLGLNPKLAARIKSADLIVAAGCRLNDPSTNGYATITAPRTQQRLVHIHADPDELGRVFAPDLAICSSMHQLLGALREAQPAGTAPWASWRKEARQDFLDFTHPVAKTPRAGVDLTAVMGHLSETLPDDTIITNGAGNYTVWVHRYYRYRHPKTQLAPVSGAMGYGLPAAIAAKARFPDRKVVCFAGDGCFLMYPQEISTAVQIGAPIVILLVNNGLYGTIRMHQERYFPGRPIGTDLPPTDFVKLAESFGAYGELVNTTAEFPAALQRALAEPRPALLELRTDPAQITPEGRITIAQRQDA